MGEDGLVVVTYRTSDPRSAAWGAAYSLLVRETVSAAETFSIVPDQPKTDEPIPPRLARLLSQVTPAAKPSGVTSHLYASRWSMPIDVGLIEGSIEAYRFVLWGPRNWVLRSEDWAMTVSVVTSERRVRELVLEAGRVVPLLPVPEIRPFREQSMHERKDWSLPRQTFAIGTGIVVTFALLACLLTHNLEWLFALGLLLESTIIPLREPGPLTRVGGRYLIPESSPADHRLNRVVVIGSIAVLAASLALPAAWLLASDAGRGRQMLWMIAGASALVFLVAMQRAFAVLRPFDRYR